MTSDQAGLLMCIGGIFGPLAIVLAAGGIGYALGCPVNEGGSACMALGVDIGPLLAAMFSFFWLMFLIPVCMVGAAIFTVKIALGRR